MEGVKSTMIYCKNSGINVTMYPQYNNNKKKRIKKYNLAFPPKSPLHLHKLNKKINVCMELGKGKLLNHLDNCLIY
jgi:hypothetical protein